LASWSCLAARQCAAAAKPRIASDASAQFERRTLAGKPEAAREPFRFAGDQAVAVREKDLEEEGEERTSAAPKSGAPEQLGLTFHFDTIAESCESSSAMTVLERRPPISTISLPK
jgi:hypothetical protein